MFFLLNDVVKCVKTVHFCDDTTHEKGQVFTITKDTLSYFNHNSNDYILWHRG